MKKIVKQQAILRIAGIVALMAAMVFAMTACGGDDGGSHSHDFSGA
jgi:hypothetical protein